MRLFAAALAATCVAPLAAGQHDPFAESRILAVDGASLAYVSRGHGGTPLVFVHGSGADLRTFGYQLQFFETSRQVIVYSRRYHHPNAPPADNADYRLDDHAADLAVLVRTLAGGRADLVGTSSGGVVALQLAADQPQLVRRLVLVEPVVFSLLAEGEMGAAGERLDRARAELRAGAPEAALNSFVTAIIGPGAYDFMPASARRMLHDNLPELVAEARAPLPGTSPPLTCERIGAVRAPALVIAGGSSAPFLQQLARRVAGCLGLSGPEVIAGAAHAVHAQQVQAFNARLLAFVDR